MAVRGRRGGGARSRRGCVSSRSSRPRSPFHSARCCSTANSTVDGLTRCPQCRRSSQSGLGDLALHERSADGRARQDVHPDDFTHLRESMPVRQAVGFSVGESAPRCQLIQRHDWLKCDPDPPGNTEFASTEDPFRAVQYETELRAAEDEAFQGSNWRTVCKRRYPSAMM